MLKLASRIRDITKEVAAAVITEAIEEDLVEGYREMDARELHKLNQVNKAISTFKLCKFGPFFGHAWKLPLL